jgi:uncharacterized damage-inducible protein DinB
MELNDLLIDAFGRVQEGVHAVLDGLDADDLVYRPSSDANSIAWLVWHLTRIEDDHVAHLLAVEQRYTAEGWADRFDFPFDPSAHGYGQTSEEVAQVRVDDPQLLADYQDAAHAQAVAYCTALDAAELERIVDTHWDPPVTAGVRIVSVIDDALEHAGQAAYVRGLLGK